MSEDPDQVSENRSAEDRLSLLTARAREQRPPRPRALWVRYIWLALMVGLLAVVVGFAVFSARDEQASLPVKDFTTAAYELDIEPVAEWPEFTAENVRLRLPARFEVVEPEQFDLLMDTAFYLLGPDYAQIEQALEGHPSIFVLTLRDTSNPPSGVGVLVARFTIPPGVRVDDYVNVIRAAPLPPGVKLTEWKVMTLDGRRVGRLICEMNIFGREARGVQFVIQRHLEFWILGGSAFKVEFDNWLSVFQESVRTLQID